MHLYVHQRTKACRLLGVATCTRSVPVQIREDGAQVDRAEVVDTDAFARADGFEDFEDLKGWFRMTHCLPFDGVLIAWSEAQRG